MDSTYNSEKIKIINNNNNDNYDNNDNNNNLDTDRELMPYQIESNGHCSRD